MKYTKEEFKRLWNSSDDGGGITFDDIADCAEAWGLFSRPRCAKIDDVAKAVLKAAGCDGIDEEPSEELEGNEIYLITIKDSLSRETLTKKAYRNVNKALEEYQAVIRSKLEQGYDVCSDHQVTATQYIKTAKLTYWTGNTVRLRLENIPFVD